MQKIMATVKEFSAMTGIGQNRVREMCYIPGFPATREGNKFLIHIEEADHWLAERARRQEGIESAALKRVEM